MEGLGERLAEVRQRIQRAGGDWRSITVVAVTKGHGPDAVRCAYDAGLRDFGESYASELLGKQASLGEREAAGTSPLPGPARWHFLGAVQRNKVRRMAGAVDVWHSVSRLEEGACIARHATGASVLVQVNATAAVHRNGCSWDEAPALVRGLQDQGLDVRGLMCLGPRPDPRPQFRRLAGLAAQLALPEVSMGMSQDLEVAVQEGSTIVRVGTALFGPRPERADLGR